MGELTTPLRSACPAGICSPSGLGVWNERWGLTFQIRALRQTRFIVPLLGGLLHEWASGIRVMRDCATPFYLPLNLWTRASRRDIRAAIVQGGAKD